ncbi:MAG: potassium-transporting ATPase subunit C [Elusimicrobia bacterium GWC2_64_44]|nr:MAG: potassium-transporting ATPase subunit C [Elusimicrobia bacterium GWC2_64_44]
MKNTIDALKLFLVLTVLTGLVYPLVVWGGARLFLTGKAGGSLVSTGGMEAGSELVGQAFAKPGYFHPRPSAIGYNPMPSGGTNQSLTSASLRASVKDRRAGEGGKTADLLFASGSGLDPHISPAAAKAQCARVARARGAAESDIISLVDSLTEGRQLGFLGEPRVNVLRLNMKLDGMPIK